MKRILTIFILLILSFTFSFTFAEEDLVDLPVEDADPPQSVPDPDLPDSSVPDPVEVSPEDPDSDIPDDPILDPDPLPPEDPEPDPIPDLQPDPIISLYFSEIAWMGTVASANDEWMELYNPNSIPVDLEDWVIRSQDLTFEIGLSGIIDSDDFFLLERTDDTTINDISADQIYTGALKNDGMFLELVDSFDRVIDQIDTWHAGDNEFKASMERADYDLSGLDSSVWCTNNQITIGGLGADGNFIFGTPKQSNSCNISISEPEPDLPADPQPDPDTDPDSQSDPDPTPNPVPENHPPIPVIQIQGDTAYMHVNVTGGDSSDPDGDSLAYFWDYGDGHTDASENPKSYYYEVPGEKTITLTVTDELGLSAKDSVSWTATEKAKKTGGSKSSKSPVPSVIPKVYQKGVVTIDRVLPNPEGRDSGAEAIVLKNNLSESVDLKGWKLADLKGAHIFSESVTLPSRSSLQINQDVFKIGLNNDKESLYFYDPAGNLIDEMSYQSASSGRWIINTAFLYDGISGLVQEVLDGDTFKILLENREFSVRLIGVDTPETIHPDVEEEEDGYEASQFLSDLLHGQMVRLEFDENKMDIYGRLLAYVYLDDLFVNTEIIKQGYGSVYTKYPFKYSEEFILLENDLNKPETLYLESEEELSFSFIVSEELSEDTDSPVKPEDEIAVFEDDIQGQNSECLSDFLKIDSFLPNSQKGESMEYIQLINVGEETVCLSGWQLDDMQAGGSKPFVIHGGSIASGGTRMFRKSETKLSLNNKDDCVFLVRPDESVADQICYGKTHKNEIFTHAGGDYEKLKTRNPKLESNSKTQISKPKKARHSFDRDAVLYRGEFKTSSLTGRIDYIYEEGEVMYLALEDHSILPVSYASGFFDVAMADSLLDRDELVAVKLYGFGNEQQLVAIDTLATSDKVAEVRSVSFIWYFLFFLFFTGGFYVVKFLRSRI